MRSLKGLKPILCKDDYVRYLTTLWPMTQSSPNKVVRKPGRGLRPYLLIPKVLAVAVYFGTTFSAAVLWFLQIGCRDLDKLYMNLGLVMTQVMTIRTMIVFMAVPALVLALVLGVLLILEHPRVMLKLRWLQVKLILLGVGIPSFHIYMASRLYHFRHILESGTLDASLRTQLNVGFALLLIWSVLLIWLGRHKPKLWQNWARSFRSKA